MFLAMPSSHVKPAEEGRWMARNHPQAVRYLDEPWPTHPRPRSIAVGSKS
jgi:hypothetical protein